jgi:RHS repeat-associated protein
LPNGLAAFDSICEPTVNVCISSDDDDNLLNVQTNYYAAGSIAFSKAVAYTYNPDGSKASTVVPSGTFSYSYDAAGRPTSVTNPFAETTSWSYENNNWISGQTLGNGGTTSYTLNARGRDTDLINKDGAGTILSNFSGMTYDAVGNRTYISASMTNATYSGNTTYANDGQNELTSETSTRDGSYSNSFAYDMAENPTTMRSVSGTTYNSDNQNTTTGYAFDGDGNPSTYGGKGMVFDAENRLASMKNTGGTVIFSAGYDAQNLRAWKTEGSTTTYYLYAQGTTLPVCELNSSGTVLATNTYAMNGLVSRRASTTSTFYEFDPQGSVSERLNSSGSCTVSSITDSFGLVTNGSSVSDPFGYAAQAGYFTDSSTGLILTTFRYYDPVAGRFLNRDPSGHQGGVDLYNYAQNNAQDKVDPLGLEGEGPPSSGRPVPVVTVCKPTCTPNPLLDFIVGALVAAVLTLFFTWLDIQAPLLVNAVDLCIQGAIAAWVGQVVADSMDDCGGPPTKLQVEEEVSTAAIGCGVGMAINWLNGGPVSPLG